MKNLKKQQGMVLIITLTILAILALIVLTEMENILLFQKAFNTNLTKDKDFYELERKLNQLINKPLNKQCIVENIDEKLIKTFCKLSSDSYYLIKRLGVYPCLKTFSNAKLTSTEHWFIYLFNAQNHKKIMQIRFIAANEKNKEPCLKQEKIINLATASWSWG
ncbi:MAG: hypothetical protein LCH30_08720 [Proteobacteria bacterium]|nr:hypothetical protein [Pseudomonadota bacterium]